MKPKTFAIVCLGIFSLFFITGGCLQVEKRPYLEKHSFVLDVDRFGEGSATEIGSVLKIHKFRISPGYEGKTFVYRTSDLTYESDFYNEFFVPPASIIGEAVRRWLAKSGLFQQVVDFSGYAEPAYVLEGSVATLHGDYRAKRATKAVMEIQFFLIDDDSPHSDIVFQKQYRQEIKLKGSSPTALVQGWSEALRQVLTDFEKDLRKQPFKTGQ